ncbi:MAG: DUF308 domain-containing protein, partial [Chlamydiia bacterium]|nr:DUF308 domain-containing protein [Chlamydiia bacterium]
MDTSSVWKIPLWEGIFFFIIGVLACAHPVFTTYSVTYVLGALLLVSGLDTGLRVCTHRIVGQYWINIFNALLLVVVGALIFIHPTVAVFTVTSIVTAFL